MQQKHDVTKLLTKCCHKP